jgi:hypothetical protein
MRNLVLIFVALFAASAARGQVVDVDAKGQYVPLNEIDWLDLGNGDEAYPGYRRHIAATGKDGRTESHWCYGTNIRKIESDKPGFDFAAGYCTIFDEEGDAYWTWFEVDGLGSFVWTVMGGTGKYKGAKGSGVSTAESTMPDGTAVFVIKGKIELSNDGGQNE